MEMIVFPIEIIPKNSNAVMIGESENILAKSSTSLKPPKIINESVTINEKTELNRPNLKLVDL